MKGTLIGASDGSLQTISGKWPRGGYSYSRLQAYEDDGERIHGYGSTPSSTGMTSQTTELYGILAIVLCTNLVIRQQGMGNGKILA